MSAWPDRRIPELFGIDLPIIQAPMAGNTTPEMVIAVSEAGGLGSLACAQYDLAQARQALAAVRAGTRRPFNVNFFSFTPPAPDAAREQGWQAALAPYYAELGLSTAAIKSGPGRTPFDAEFCALVEEYRPAVVSFHFGLPAPELLARVRASGARVIASATTVAEAVWLEQRGCDAIIAMGLEAGGHRGNFLGEGDARLDMARQVGTFALVPQVVDAVRVPVIAAGGIADARGIVAALALGAAAVQIGTAYLFTPEARVSPLYRQALATARDDSTVVTNVFTGRPARGIVNRLIREIGPITQAAPAFPLAAAALAPLRASTEAQGVNDFVNLWAGQAVALGRALPAGELTTKLAEEALGRMRDLAGL